MKTYNAEFVRAVHSPADFPRDSLPQIAFAGRSNVGKSSMINCLLAHKNIARISSHPGKTRTINFLLINRKFYFVDLPGYGYAKVSKAERQQWKRLIESYLIENQNLKALIHIIDSRIGLTERDEEMLLFSQGIGLKTLIAATKIDKLKQSDKVKQLRGIESRLSEYSLTEYIPFSARTKVGRNDVLRWIDDCLGS
jgi:GTP-binding protein